MLKGAEFFWKNFRLGTELQISGSFLYNALYFFDKMEHFYFEDECFEFLYNTSVGLERLEKVALILLEHNNEFDQERFEKTLITHNHLDLIKRIKKYKNINLGKNHNKFLQLLSNFYNSSRYDRYNISSVFHEDQDKEMLVKFVAEGLNIEIVSDSMFPTIIDGRIKKFIGKTVSKIATQLYDIIRERAFELNIYTYELTYFSKAFKIFIEREYTFDKEKTLKREILLNLMNNKKDEGFFRFIESLEPINLEMYNTNEYVKFLIDFHKQRHMLGELDAIYEENKFEKERGLEIDAIGGDVTFDIEKDEDFE